MATQPADDPRRYPVEALQANLDAADAALPETFKQRYPIRSRAEVEAANPNKWLALLPTRIDPTTTRVTDGRLLATARGRRALEQQIAPLLPELPRRYPFTYFNYRPKNQPGGQHSGNGVGATRSAL